MNQNKAFALFLLPALLLTAAPWSQAHDPGLSRANIQLHADALTLTMAFARQDLEGLVPMDTDHDGTLTAAEFSAARAALQRIIAAGIELQNAGRTLSPRSIRAEPTPDDAVHVALSYPLTAASDLRLKIALIARLAAGHRQYLTVLDASGNRRLQQLLDARTAPLPLNGPGPDRLDVFHGYLVEGIWHIWIGFDHILFLVTLLLPAVLIYRQQRWHSLDRLRPAIMDILKIVTAFTLAHSITLVLAVLEVVTLPSRLIEPIIALSVLVTAINNLRPVFPGTRWLLAFGFGLIHGFGFAGVLADLGLPADALGIALLAFNLGVETGQLAIVACLFPLAAVLRHTRLYRLGVLGGGSAVAALIAMIWMFERVFDYELLGF